MEALEIGALLASSEASPFDATELADDAAPAPPEEAAMTERAGIFPDENGLTIGLPAAVDLDRLEDVSLDDLIEAGLVAIDEGDPATAATSPPTSSADKATDEDERHGRCH